MDSYLGAHPDIFMARKEMHFFGADLRFSSRFYRRDLKAYLAEYEECTSQQMAGEASVWYLLSERAATEIRMFNPEAKIIIMLRDPVELLHSMYYQFRFDHNEHLRSFEEALAAEEDRKAGKCVNRLAYFPQGLIYRKIVSFTEHVSRYFQVFGRERVKIIIYDDFAASPAAIYQDIVKFLGLDPTRNGTHFDVINANRSVKSPVLRNVLSEPVVRSALIAMKPLLPSRVFPALQKFEARLWRSNTQEQKRPPLAPEFRASLKREFAPEIEKLSALLGRDLTRWSRVEA
jgi:hypothetical protein